MTWPEPASVLRHRGPALLVGAIDAFAGETLCCRSRDDGPWSWGRLLEATAQTAGLLAGFLDPALRARPVIAEYRALRLATGHHTGPLRLVARLDRRLLHFRRCRVEARAADGTLLLEGFVTVAPGAAP
jgi:hypothetical protein